MTTSQTAHYKLALDYASKDFDEADPVRRAFVNVVNFILESQVQYLSHLTFGMLRDAAKLGKDEGEVLHRTIAYLTGARANLLVIGYEYMADDYVYELNADDVQTFLETGEFCDPRTGLEVVESASSIYVFFRPNFTAFH